MKKSFAIAGTTTLASLAVSPLAFAHATSQPHIHTEHAALWLGIAVGLAVAAGLVWRFKR